MNLGRSSRVHPAQPVTRRVVSDGRNSRVSEDMLACKVCLGQYNNTDCRPRTLYCQHTFCERCITGFLIHVSKKNRRNRRRDQQYLPGEMIVCPLCRCHSRLSQPGIDALVINKKAVDIVQTARKPQVTHEGRDFTVWKGKKSGKGSKRKQFHWTVESNSGGMGDTIIVQQVCPWHPPPEVPSAAAAVIAAEVVQDLSSNPCDPIGQLSADQLAHRIDGVDLESGVEEPAVQVPVGFDDIESVDDDDLLDECPTPPENLDWNWNEEPIVVYPVAEMLLTAPNARSLAGGDDSVFEGSTNEPDDFLIPTAIYTGKFGKYDGSTYKPGAFRCPSSISFWTPPSSTAQPKLVVVDRGTAVQVLAANGDYLSGFQMEGVRGACFIADGDRLAVLVRDGVTVCNLEGVVDKNLPLGLDVVAVARYRRGFVAAHRSRLSLCEQYRPTAVLRSITGVRPAGIGQSISSTGSVQQFSNITHVTANDDELCVLDSDVIYVLNSTSGALRSMVNLGADCAIGVLHEPIAVALDPGRRNIVVADGQSRRVLMFDAVSGTFVRCLVQLDFDGGTAVSGSCRGVAVGTAEEGRQQLYVVVSGAQVAEVRMYRM